MSHAPRPYRRPSRTDATNGSLVHSERGSADTASMCPLKTNDRPPPATPGFPARSRGRPSNDSPGGTSGIPANVSGVRLPQYPPTLRRHEPPGQVLLQRGLVPARIPHLYARSCRTRSGRWRNPPTRRRPASMASNTRCSTAVSGIGGTLTTACTVCGR